MCAADVVSTSSALPPPGGARGSATSFIGASAHGAAEPGARVSYASGDLRSSIVPPPSTAAPSAGSHTMACLRVAAAVGVERGRGKSAQAPERKPGVA